MRSRSERMNGATLGLRDIAQTSTEGSSREFFTMGESLMEQCRVTDEGLRIVKVCYKGRSSKIGNDFSIDPISLSYQKATANYVPAAAVITIGGKRYPDLLGVKRA